MINNIKEIALKIKNQGGRAYFVGGCVRDKIMGLKTSDMDVEVLGIDRLALEKILSEYNVDYHGAKFGVYKLDNVDIAISREEIKTGNKHTDFSIKVNPFLDMVSAGSRRDFTVNTIYEDVLTGEIFDNFGGVSDIKRRRLKAVNYDTFIDDELRVLRCASFYSRLNFKVEKKTLKLCKTARLKSLTSFRIKDELYKALVNSKKPSLFFKFLKRINNLSVLFPELENKKIFNAVNKSIDKGVKEKRELEYLLFNIVKNLSDKNVFFTRLDFDNKTIKKVEKYLTEKE